MSTPGENYGQWDAGQQTMPPKPKNGMGTAALVFGILAILTCWFPILGLVLGIVAIVLGAVGRSRVKKMQATNGGVAITGLVLGILSVIANILVSVVFGLGALAFFQSGGGNTIAQLQDCLSQAQNAGNPAAVQQAIQQCQEQASQQLPGGGGGQ